MPRPTADEDKRYFRAIVALQAAFDRPEFRERLDRVLDSLLTGYLTGRPYRQVKDGSFTGPYYELRELCDDFLLPWPDAAELIFRSLKDDPLKLRPPSKQALDHFRVAREGLAQPTADEVERLKRRNGHIKPHRRSRFDPSQGFTYEQIAALDNVTARTVESNVKAVRRYLTGKRYVTAGYETPEGKELIEQWIRAAKVEK